MPLSSALLLLQPFPQRHILIPQLFHPNLEPPALLCRAYLPGCQARGAVARKYGVWVYHTALDGLALWFSAETRVEWAQVQTRDWNWPGNWS